jgi:hypothetical protein
MHAVVQIPPGVLQASAKFPAGLPHLPMELFPGFLHIPASLSLGSPKIVAFVTKVPASVVTITVTTSGGAKRRE